MEAQGRSKETEKREAATQPTSPAKATNDEEYLDDATGSYLPKEEKWESKQPKIVSPYLSKRAPGKFFSRQDQASPRSQSVLSNSTYDGAMADHVAQDVHQFLVKTHQKAQKDAK